MASSKQEVLGQSQAASDIGLHQSLCRPTRYMETNTKRQPQWGDKKKKRPQMKEQENSPEEELSEVEASHLSDIEFKVMIIRILRSMKETDKPLKRTSQK